MITEELQKQVDQIEELLDNPEIMRDLEKQAYEAGTRKARELAYEMETAVPMTQVLGPIPSLLIAYTGGASGFLVATMAKTTAIVSASDKLEKNKEQMHEAMRSLVDSAWAEGLEAREGDQ